MCHLGIAPLQDCRQVKLTDGVAVADVAQVYIRLQDMAQQSCSCRRCAYSASCSHTFTMERSTLLQHIKHVACVGQGFFPSER